MLGFFICCKTKLNYEYTKTVQKYHDNPIVFPKRFLKDSVFQTEKKNLRIVFPTSI